MDGAIDATRRDVIQKWQHLAHKSADVSFSISAGFLESPVIISANTDYHNDDADHWVEVERYIHGVIEDLGGSKKSNVHIRLQDGRQITVNADRSLLRNDTVNRLYKDSMLRIRADYNIMTRAIRNARLQGFVEHCTELDEAQLERMTEHGRAAWKDIKNASEWVDELRGANCCMP